MSCCWSLWSEVEFLADVCCADCFITTVLRAQNMFIHITLLCSWWRLFVWQWPDVWLHVALQLLVVHWLPSVRCNNISYWSRWIVSSRYVVNCCYLRDLNNHDNDNCDSVIVFIVLLPWSDIVRVHPVNFVECSECQVAASPQTNSDVLGCEFAGRGCYHPHPPLLFTQPGCPYWFYCLTEGGRLSHPGTAVRVCSLCSVPKVVCRSGCHGRQLPVVRFEHGFSDTTVMLVMVALCNRADHYIFIL